MNKEELTNGLYVIKDNDKDYSLTSEKEKEIDSLEIEDEYKTFFKNVLSETPKKFTEVIVELEGENPFLVVKSVKNSETGEDITDRFNRHGETYNELWTITKSFVWEKLNQNKDE